jgi:hypothetical protein
LKNIPTVFFLFLIISRHVDIHSQTKNTIFNVYNYFKKLSNNKVNVEVAKYFCQTQQITADACGVSLSTVKRITTEGVKSMVHSEPEVGLSCISFTSSRKQYKRAKYVTSTDDFDANIVRRTIHEFYDNCEYSTTTKLLSKYQEKTEYKGSKTSMW